MPITVDLDSEVFIKAEDRDLSKGVDLLLTPEQLATVVLTKYISVNPLTADWQPEGEWFEEVTADIGGGAKKERILINANGTLRGVGIDDGLIIGLRGTLARVVGILPGKAAMSEEEIEAHTELTGEPVPLYQQWDFRVRYVKKTDGPQARADMHRTEDQRRRTSEAKMFESFAEMAAIFKAGMGQVGTGTNLSPDVQSVIDAGLAKAKVAVK